VTQEEAKEVASQAHSLWVALNKFFESEHSAKIVAGAMPVLIQDMRMQSLIENGRQLPLRDTGTVWANGIPATGVAQHTYTPGCDGFHAPGRCKTADQW
jgi:hypothetical protein